jgi:hypothetical protein
MRPPMRQCPPLGLPLRRQIRATCRPRLLDTHREVEAPHLAAMEKRFARRTQTHKAPTVRRTDRVDRAAPIVAKIRARAALELHKVGLVRFAHADRHLWPRRLQFRKL